jgi:hypothetical protein
MGKYKYDMSGESAPKTLLPKGWRKFRITDGEEQLSKKGNPMFKFTFLDIDTQTSSDVYAITTQGKRWFLKQILSACHAPAGEDGVYDWDLPDVIGKVVRGRVDHEDNEWINREGKKQVTLQSKIVEVIEDGEIVKETPSVDVNEDIPEIPF